MRLNVAGRVLASYTAVLVMLSFFGGEGRWLAMLLAIASWPLLLLALFVSFTFASQIVRRPLLWASAAVLISFAAGYCVGDRVGLIFGGLVALPAAAVFVVSLRKWPARPAQLG